MKEHHSVRYDISMRTPIGVRTGHMTVFWEKSRIKGFLEILNHREPFEGSVDADGTCRLIGKIVTWMRTVPYVATGSISQDALSLSFTDACQTLKITGIANAAERSDKPCENSTHGS